MSSSLRSLLFAAVCALALSAPAAPVLPPWLPPLPEGLDCSSRTVRWTEKDFSHEIDLPRALSPREIADYSDALVADGWTARLLPASADFPLSALRAQGRGDLADGLETLFAAGASQWEKPPADLFYLPGKNLLLCTFPFSEACPAPAAEPGAWLFSTAFLLPGAEPRMRVLSVARGSSVAVEFWTLPRFPEGFLDAARARLVASGWEFVPPVGEAPFAAGGDTAAADAALVGGLFSGTASFRSPSGEEATISLQRGEDGKVACIFLLRSGTPGFPSPAAGGGRP